MLAVRKHPFHRPPWKTMLTNQCARSCFVNSGQEIVSVDHIDCGRLIGWYKSLDGDASIISIVIGDNHEMEIAANLPRQDVAMAGYGAPECGFDLVFQPPLPVSTQIAIVSKGTGKELLSAIVYDEGMIMQSGNAAAEEPVSLFGVPSVPAPQEPFSERGVAIAGNNLILFDISDLVYYIGHHDNLTGIQRVQSCILLAMLRHGIYDRRRLLFLSYNNHRGHFIHISVEFMSALLEDLLRPARDRRIAYSREDAKVGLLPQSAPLHQSFGALAGQSAVLCLLGAAWVNRDYFRRVVELKRVLDLRFAMVVHDLIPIYARETCDQGTARVFTSFLKRALRNTDLFFAVSQNTARDLQRYAEEIGVAAPPVIVTQNGSTFDEFIAAGAPPSPLFMERIRKPFTLFVSTIEGRKNHIFVFRVWQELVKAGVDVPDLVCVGRLGWRAEQFLSKLTETNNLQRRIHILKDVSDEELDWLYKNCLFTVYPSLYEGWGLPVGESLAKGKLCVTSRTSSLPEVGGDCAVYIDPNDTGSAIPVLRRLITDAAWREGLEHKVVTSYQPVSWRTVAERVITGCLEAGRKPRTNIFPTIDCGQEYCFGALPDALSDRLGEEMMAQILEARRARLTSAYLSDAAFLAAEEFRIGESWCEPESWGVWSRYPDAGLGFLLPQEAQGGVQACLLLNVPDPLRGMSFHIEEDGEILAAGYLNSEEVFVTFRMQPRHDAEGRVLPSRLMVRTRHDPAKQAELRAIDARGIGLGFKRFLVNRFDDVLGRLEVMERLSMRALEKPAG
ncbi:glycosyltransferase family 1 protein (plasmid) [Azospirillum argentinense]|uniref:Glycosyltransferase family 1 protein n=2 Tax=Azospirillum TaxID=191 RepID=A0A4D8QG44_AZOBR|nr:glycosyltransferase family 1 protein [Azospirillum argentinense]